MLPDNLEDMELYLSHLKIEESVIYEDIKLLRKMIDEAYHQSPEITIEFLMYLQKEYRSVQPEVVDNETQTECSRILPVEGNDLPVTVDCGTQTDNFETQNVSSAEAPLSSWDIKNIADDVASVAKQNLEANGFVYDEKSGLYYDHALQCYYNPTYKLYYYPQTGAYYYYDEETKGLKYYCSASETGSPSMKTADVDESEVPKSPKKAAAPEKLKVVEELEPGEILDSEDEENCNNVNSGPAVIEAGPKPFEPDHSRHVAPCIKILVKSTNNTDLRPGTLFIVTCTGGTLGREGSHDILLPDQLVSKSHLSFQYVYKKGSYFYEVIDMGSKNGTFLNGQRLSNALVKSEPFEVAHGSVISVGGTDLLCHIHAAYETCEECGSYCQVHEGKTTLNEISLKKKHSMETSAIKKKFGITHNSIMADYPPGYEDRSQARRKAVGSSHPSEKTEASCIYTPIDKRNKGFALMSKMGWIEGKPLGKNEEGILEPVNTEVNEGKKGLGFDEAASSVSIPSKEV